MKAWLKAHEGMLSGLMALVMFSLVAPVVTVIAFGQTNFDAWSAQVMRKSGASGALDIAVVTWLRTLSYLECVALTAAICLAVVGVLALMVRVSDWLEGVHPEDVT